MADHPGGDAPRTTGSHAAGSRAAGAPASGGAAHSDDPAAIQAEIERTREQLGETVEALSAKLDVKTRTKVAVDGAIHDDRGQVRPVVPAAGFAAVLLVVGLVLWRRRKD